VKGQRLLPFGVPGIFHIAAGRSHDRIDGDIRFVEAIAGYSTQARGRSERAFLTLQDRLPKEIDSLDGGRGRRTRTDAARHQTRTTGQIVSYQNRTVSLGLDRDGSFRSSCKRAFLSGDLLKSTKETASAMEILQIPQQTHRHHYVRSTVRVHQYPDATLPLFDGPRCLARYDRDAKLTQPNEQRAA
jgi:hypothetical protein